MRNYCFIEKNMAASQANANSLVLSADGNTCNSCCNPTKYCCIRCEMPICNKCAVFEENEETPGWAMGKSVGYCEACYRRPQTSRSTNKPSVSNTEDSRSTSPHSESSAKPQDSEPEESPNGDWKDDSTASSSKKLKKVGRKSTWSVEQLDDFIDIILSNENYKTKLIFQNTKKQKNGLIYERILKELKERCANRREEMPFGVEQLRSKFKKCVGECKWVSMTIKTATGVDNFIDKKGYGAWFNQLYAIIQTRDSCQPEQAVEPSSATSKTDSENLPDHSSESETSAKKQKLFVPVKNRKRKQNDDYLSETLKMMKTIIENDPSKDLIKLIRDDLERSREHELKMAELMFSTGSQNPFMSAHNPMSVHNPMSTMQHGGFGQQNLNGEYQQPYYPLIPSVQQNYPMQNEQQGSQLCPVSPLPVPRPPSANSCHSGSSCTTTSGHSEVIDDSNYSPRYHSL